MALVLLVGGLALLAFPGLVRPLGRHLPPGEWARLCSVLLVGGAVVLDFAFLLLAAPSLLRAVGIPELAEACERLLGPFGPGGPVLGWSAAAAAAVLSLAGVVGSVRTWRRQRRFRIEACVGDHHLGVGHDLVILPTPELLAFSVGGSRPQVVLSEGLVGRVSTEELDAVIRHESAHLRHRHGRFLLIAAVLDFALGWLPFVKRSTMALRVGLERWADEVAAGPVGSSRAVLRGSPRRDHSHA